MKTLLTATAVISAFGSTSLADIPSLGGTMSHLLVTLFQNEIFITFESPNMATVEMQGNPGTFTGSPEVLNDFGYNGQFGWIANGFISLPPSSGIFIRTISMSRHLSVFEQGSFDEILGTGDSDSTWQWNGTMTHNWYATEVRGLHSARYEVFVGDLSGSPLDGFESGLIELNFEYGPVRTPLRNIHHVGSARTVPSPNALSVLALGSIAAFKRRR